MGRPRSVHYVSGHEVDVQEEPMFKYVRIITWKQASCWSRRVVSIMLRSGVHNCGRLLEQMIKCVVLVVGLLPLPLRPPDVNSRDGCSQVFPVFHWSSMAACLYYCEHKQKVKWEKPGIEATVRQDTACICSSPDPSLLWQKWVWFARLGHSYTKSRA